MIENLMIQINLIAGEIKGERIPQKRVLCLIEQTKEIAKKLDITLKLDGVLVSKVDFIYNNGETEYPKKRLRKVIQIFFDEVLKKFTLIEV